jgi:hypothetical protein
MVEDCFSEVGEEVETIMWWRACCMIRRDKDAVEGPQASTYLAMAMAEPGGRFGAKPMVTGAAEMVVLPGPAWCHDPTGIEPPLGFSIEEVGAALGGAGSEPLHSAGVEVSSPQVSSGQKSGANAEQ